jgi:thiol-disulfide isomerase/thioredoxin
MLHVLFIAAAAAVATPNAAETRVVEYLKANVKPGQPVVVSQLANTVFTAPDERAALDRLFNIFFKLPLFVAQHQRRTSRPPTLVEISEQFRLQVPGEADVLLRVMESDPRMPRFLERDPQSGEIKRVDVDAIVQHPRFGRELERSLAGLVGKPAPAFAAATFAGGSFTSSSLAGKPHVVYFWFTGCPPCMQTAPLLAELAKTRAVPVIAVNIDRVLELDATDADRAAYASKLPAFTMVHATPEIQAAYGGVSVFPTLFFVDKQGVVVQQLVNRQEKASLDAAILEAQR